MKRFSLFKSDTSPSKTKSVMNTDHLLSDLLGSCRDGNVTKVKALMQHSQISEVINGRNASGRTPLYFAVIENHIEIIKILVANGADMSAEIRASVNPFMQACYAMEPLTSDIASIRALNNFEEIITIFLEKGFDLNATHGMSKSYLGQLVEAGAIDAMKILIKYGANIHIKDQFSYTPLHIAACIRGNYYEEQLAIAKWLLAQGIDRNARTDQGITAYDLAVECKFTEMRNLILDTNMNDLSYNIATHHSTNDATSSSSSSTITDADREDVIPQAELPLKRRTL